MAIPDGAIGRIIVFGHFAIAISRNISMKSAPDICTELLVADAFIARSKCFAVATFLGRIVKVGAIPPVLLECRTVKP